MMKIQVITLFPEMFPGVLNASMLWKAQEKDLVSFRFVNLRDFGLGKRKTVDDTPYGGGDGMLLKPEPLVGAIESAKSTVSNQKSTVILLTPRGKKFTQSIARRLSKGSNLIFVCGRYEGYDERVTEFVDEQISIGDYVLTGGELPAMVVIDSIVRLIPGVLGGEKSAEIESFSDGNNVEFAQYTRPENFRGMKVPKVLLNGNHAEIDKWRKEESSRG